MNPLPAPRKVPVVPRPRHGELSGSYLWRVAQANRIGFRPFLCLLGATPSAVASKKPDLAIMVLTLNDTAFTRLLAYTGLDGGNSSRRSRRSLRDPRPRASRQRSGSRT